MTDDDDDNGDGWTPTFDATRAISLFLLIAGFWVAVIYLLRGSQ